MQTSHLHHLHYAPKNLGLLKSLTNRIVRSSSSLRPPAEAGSTTPEQIADARSSSSLAPATFAERRKSLATRQTTVCNEQGIDGDQIARKFERTNIPFATTLTPTRRDHPRPAPCRGFASAWAPPSPVGAILVSFLRFSLSQWPKGGRDGMSAADVIRQDWKKKIIEEGDEGEESRQMTLSTSFLLKHLISPRRRADCQRRYRSTCLLGSRSQECQLPSCYVRQAQTAAKPCSIHGNSRNPPEVLRLLQRTLRHSRRLQYLSRRARLL